MTWPCKIIFLKKNCLILESTHFYTEIHRLLLSMDNHIHNSCKHYDIKVIHKNDNIIMYNIMFNLYLIHIQYLI